MDPVKYAYFSAYNHIHVHDGIYHQKSEWKFWLICFSLFKAEYGVQTQHYFNHPILWFPLGQVRNLYTYVVYVFWKLQIYRVPLPIKSLSICMWHRPTKSIRWIYLLSVSFLYLLPRDFSGIPKCVVESIYCKCQYY